VNWKRKELALQALSKALDMRSKSGYEFHVPICIYDFVEKNGVEVRFIDISSMEGMYVTKPGPNILISSLRPAGRQCFTCAHEFGHYVFKHSSVIDELIPNSNKRNNYSSEEFLVDCFAAFLLMPEIAVKNAFKVRGWNPNNALPLHIYTIAGYLGVGYSTLITHMQESLGLLEAPVAKKLLNIQPSKIKKEMLGHSTGSNFLIVDENWKNRAVDIQVEDFILTPPGTVTEDDNVQKYRDTIIGRIYKGVTPGFTRIFNNEIGWSAFVRVSRKGYVGLSKYRHMAEVEGH
jgi:Zn-dependent peptidase ImmA (M78 family)